MRILGSHVHVNDAKLQSTATSNCTFSECLSKDTLNSDGRAARVLGLAADDPVEVVVLVAGVVVEADVPLAEGLGGILGRRDRVVDVGEDDHLASLVLEGHIRGRVRRLEQSNGNVRAGAEAQ